MKKVFYMLLFLLLANMYENLLFGQESPVQLTPDREARNVLAGENVTTGFLTKWMNAETLTIGNSIVYEGDNKITITPASPPTVPAEALLVNGNIGLSEILDFKEEGATIHWGNAKGIGNLKFTASNGSIENTIMTLNGQYGKVGIGTSSPEYLLHINGLAFSKQLFVEGNAVIAELGVTGNITTTMFTLFNELDPPQAGYLLQSDASGNGKWVEVDIPTPSPWLPCGTSDIYYDGGHVGIGTQPNEDFMLAVNGDINAKLLKISVNVPASDYVFQDDYKLMPLYDLEKFVNQNKHLPEVKSAKEFKEEGYNVGDMDDVLLRKVEELTLYTIAQQKQIDEQKKMVDELMQQIQLLTSELKAEGKQ